MLHRAATRLGAEDLLILCVCAFAITVSLGAGLFVTQDTWLALLSGRVIADDGLPSQDVLTIWTQGRDWVDQQWLGQLTLYGLWSIGDLELIATVHVFLVTAAFGGALLVARRRGASTRATAAVGVLALEPCLAVSGNIRTQSFALVLFVILLWLLTGDRALASRRVFWAVPLLVLWANIHGSVVLGAGVVGLAGLGALAEARPGARRATARRAAVLAVLCIAAIFASPYAQSLPAYYGDTLLNGDFRDVVAEWKSPELSPVWAPFYALGALVLFFLGRRGDRLSLFERLLLLAMLALGLMAIRNLAWFALAAAMLLPAAVSRGVADPAAGRPHLRRTWPVVLTVLIGTVAAVVAGIATVDRHVERRYPPGALIAVAAATQRDAGLRIFAAPEFADWLLWHRAELSGRVLFDARFELLSTSELHDAARYVGQTGDDWRTAADGARLSVLDPDDRPKGDLPSTSTILLRTRGARSLYRGESAAVVLLPAGSP